MTVGSSNRWHADDDLIAGYVGGSLDTGLSASLEAHLLTCDGCRARLTAQAPPRVRARVATTWDAVREDVQVPQLPWTVRVLQALGLGRDTAVLLAAARSMSTAWTAATVAVLALAALAAFPGDDAGRAAYLIIAPLVPVAGVVASFGPAADPLHDLTRATPYSAARLVLVRAGGVVASCVPLAVVLGLAVPGPQWLGVGWLAPALAFVLLVLAASTWVEPIVAGGAIAVGWAIAVAAVTRTDDPVAAVAATTQPVYLAVSVCAGVVLALRVRGSSAPSVGA